MVCHNARTLFRVQLDTEATILYYQKITYEKTIEELEKSINELTKKLNEVRI